MSGDRLVEILENAGVEVRANYSGRGMYGGRCVAFVVEESELIRTVAEIVGYAGDEERTELVRAFRGARTDNMGRDSVVVYFPKFQVASSLREN